MTFSTLFEFYKQQVVIAYGIFLNNSPAFLRSYAQWLLAIELACIRVFREAIKDDFIAAGALYIVIIGGLFVFSYPVSFARVAINFTPLAWPFRLSLKHYKPRNEAEGPSWLVLTGPTGDLGEEFAKQFAAKGFSLFLIARNAEKLEALVKRLKEQSPNNQYEAHSLDLEAPSEEDWEGLEKHLDSLHGKITILLNNAGVSHRRFVQFERVPVEDLVRIPAVNIVAVLRITRIVVPKMIAEKRGLILNIGSFSSHVPAPMLATYAGSKSFLYTWSQALGAQLEVKHIQVRVLNTFYVTTQMSRMARSWMVPSAKTYVRSAISTLGLPGGAVGRAYVSTPYWGHALADWFTSSQVQLSVEWDNTESRTESCRNGSGCEWFCDTSRFSCASLSTSDAQKTARSLYNSTWSNGAQKCSLRSASQGRRKSKVQSEEGNKCRRAPVMQS